MVKKKKRQRCYSRRYAAETKKKKKKFFYYRKKKKKAKSNCMEVREKIPINLCTAGWKLQLVSLIFLVDHVLDLFLFVVKLFQLHTSLCNVDGAQHFVSLFLFYFYLIVF